MTDYDLPFFIWKEFIFRRKDMTRGQTTTPRFRPLLPFVPVTGFIPTKSLLNKQIQALLHD